MPVLIVEDERKTAALLRDMLEQSGWEAVCVYDGRVGLEKALSGRWEAVVCDIMLPGLDGLELVREMRRSECTTPVLMLSARADVEQRVEGLDAGADDYLPKPFAASELLARLRSLVRRNLLLKPPLLSTGGLTFDPATRETRLQGRRVDLSNREGLLLECLMQAEGEAVSRRDILATVWEYDFDPGSNLVEVYIRRLREKIDRPNETSLIKTVRGRGYAIRTLP